ncbi:MAG: SurA N-terminal domain-containing protein [Nitrospirota bacterium]
MLKVIREGAIERPWFYRTIMIMIAVAFVLTMGWWGFEENKEDVIVSVGDERVAREEYLRLLQNMSRYYKDMMPGGDKMPEDQLKQMVIDQLIDSRLWMQAAREMGVIVTANEVRESIMKVPAFQHNGAFDPEQYKRLLAQNHLTPELFETSHRGDLLREKARMLVRESVAPTTDELSEVQAMLAAQPTPSVPMQGGPSPDRVAQTVLIQKKQRALQAYQEALKARAKISVRRELM